jgi:hypothetical protein
MRLIDADAVKIQTKELLNLMLDDWWDIERIIDAAPTIDAVQVVRCKDCKHWTTARYGGNCDLLMIGSIDEIDFCSAGVKNEHLHRQTH